MSTSRSTGNPGRPHGTMTTAVLYAPRDLRIEQRPVPTPSEGEVLVRILSVGVCGSDVHYYEHGHIGDFVVRSPLVLGHESSGQIVEVGKGVSLARVGEPGTAISVAIRSRPDASIADICLTRTSTALNASKIAWSKWRSTYRSPLTS
jgi:D-arabinose 1-dehydrogenase-like Zn-dependent alcohol dehydrogenase